MSLLDDLIEGGADLVQYTRRLAEGGDRAAADALDRGNEAAAKFMREIESNPDSLRRLEDIVSADAERLAGAAERLAARRAAARTDNATADAVSGTEPAAPARSPDAQPEGPQAELSSSTPAPAREARRTPDNANRSGFTAPNNIEDLKDLSSDVLKKAQEGDLLDPTLARNSSPNYVSRSQAFIDGLRDIGNIVEGPASNRNVSEILRDVADAGNELPELTSGDINFLRDVLRTIEEGRQPGVISTSRAMGTIRAARRMGGSTSEGADARNVNLPDFQVNGHGDDTPGLLTLRGSASRSENADSIREILDSRHPGTLQTLNRRFNPTATPEGRRGLTATLATWGVIGYGAAQFINKDGDVGLTERSLLLPADLVVTGALAVPELDPRDGTIFAPGTGFFNANMITSPRMQYEYAASFLRNPGASSTDKRQALADRLETESTSIPDLQRATAELLFLDTQREPVHRVKLNGESVSLGYRDELLIRAQIYAGILDEDAFSQQYEFDGDIESLEIAGPEAEGFRNGYLESITSNTNGQSRTTEISFQDNRSYIFYADMETIDQQLHYADLIIQGNNNTVFGDALTERIRGGEQGSNTTFEGLERFERNLASALLLTMNNDSSAAQELRQRQESGETLNRSELAALTAYTSTQAELSSITADEAAREQTETLQSAALAGAGFPGNRGAQGIDIPTIEREVGDALGLDNATLLRVKRSFAMSANGDGLVEPGAEFNAFVAQIEADTQIPDTQRGQITNKIRGLSQ